MKNLEQLLTLIIANIHSFEETMNFRKGQKPFYDAIIDGLKKGWTTMFIEGPTGMGKTFLEAMLAAAMIGNSNIKILLLTSKITLLKQIQREFVKFVSFLKTGLYGGGFKNYHEQVTIMTYASYQRQSEEFIKQFKVLLLDEGHRGLGKLTKIQLEKQKEFSILIGFTASSKYTEKKSLEKFLINKAHSLSIVEAVELGMLCNIQVMTTSVNIEIDGQKKGETKGDYDNRISTDIIRQGGNIAAARTYKHLFYPRNLRFLMLVLTNKQGNDLINELEKEGVKAKLVNSKMKMVERLELFEQFKNHEFDVLVGMGILKEGFNDEGVSGALMVYPINSLVDLTQFPGRALRIDEKNPDKIAFIVNMVFEGKTQLFYSDLLEGKIKVFNTQDGKKKEKDIGYIDEEDIEILSPEVFEYITSIDVEHKDIMSVIKGNNPLAHYYSLPREEQLEALKSELAKHEVNSKLTLIKLGSDKIKYLNFNSFGMIKSFAGYVLLKKIDVVTIKVLEDICSVFNWIYPNDNLRNDLIKLEFKKHNISSFPELMNCGSAKFVALSFGVFGKGQSVFIEIFGRKAGRVNNIGLKKIAISFGWDLKDTIQKAKLDLKKNEIDSYSSLSDLGSKFMSLRFEHFETGYMLARYILPKSNFRYVDDSIFRDIAKLMNWEIPVSKKTLKNALKELERNQISSYTELMNCGPTKFINLSFGVFGKGFGIASFILGGMNGENLNTDLLKKIAKKLNWSLLGDIPRLKTFLAKKEINSYKTLNKISVKSFIILDFGIFGTGSLIIRRYLNINTKIKRTHIQEFSKIIGWKNE